MPAGYKISIKVGDVFNSLTVIDETIMYNVSGNTKKRICKCRCECGSEKYYQITKLVTGYSKICRKCAYQKRPQSTEKCSTLERLYHLTIVSRCKKTDGRILNNLLISDFESLIKKDCFYCGEKPKELTWVTNNKICKKEPIVANGIDRKDPKGHYDLDNCVPCCRDCNVMKMTMTFEEFKSKIKKLYELWLKEEGDTIKTKQG